MLRNGLYCADAPLNSANFKTTNRARLSEALTRSMSLVLLAKSSAGRLYQIQVSADATVGQLKHELAVRAPSQHTMGMPI